MTLRCKNLMGLALAWLALLPFPASARVTVAFYSHEFGSSFPHTFFTVKGVPEAGGAEVDANYGFTAKAVTPAILLGSVAGEVESVKPGYIEDSDRKFALEVSDAQYAALLGVVERWRAIPGKSYNLNKRNCIHFVGEAAQAIGLTVTFDKKLIKKPRSFLENVMRLNPGLAP